MKYAFVMLLVALGLSSSPAIAAWHKAESDRFVIYSNSRAEDVAEFGRMLEKYHVAMELETGRKVPAPSPSNRLTVYMVGSYEDLRRVYGNTKSSVAGFYIPRANGSVTFVPNIRVGGSSRSRSQIGSRYARSAEAGTVDQTMSILLHEYAHHFLISSARHAMPRWLSEGAAEYFSSARFNDDGSVDIGLPNNSRAWEISQAAPVSIRELFDYSLYRKNRSRRYDAYYGRSWLLYHYLRFSPNRKGQLVRYWQAVAGGNDSLEAGEAIFGDLDTLNREIAAYGKQRKMSGMRFSASDISIGKVTATKLTAGHAAMMDVIVRSKRGLNQEDAAKLLPQARRIAERYPEDAAVLAALAEAEYDAGNDKAAIAAADRAIARDANAKNAYMQKGYALFRIARNADSDEAPAAFAKAMRPFEALNALEADHTQPLIYFYRSFTDRGVAPPDGAKFALERATQLAPFDRRLAIQVAAMKASDGDPVIAQYLLRPVAADPHGGRQARLAQAFIDVLKNVPDGQRVNFRKLREKFEADNRDSSGESASASGGNGHSPHGSHPHPHGPDHDHNNGHDHDH